MSNYLLSLALLFAFATSGYSRPGKDYALLFAVSEYTELEDLTFPIQNAEEIAKELRDRYGFETEVVKNPTLEQIYDKIDAYRNKRYADDAQLLVFFSGHGDYDETTKIGFFCPQDAQKNDRTRRSYFEYPILTREVYSINCNHILLALDACYSGSLDDRLIPKSSEWNRPKSVQVPEVDAFVKDKLQYKSRLCITSGLLEPTPDNSDFAARLLIALRTNSNPVLTFDALNATLEFARPKPRHGRLDGDGGGDFVFVPMTERDKIVGLWNGIALLGVDVYIFDFDGSVRWWWKYKLPLEQVEKVIKKIGTWDYSNGEIVIHFTREYKRILGIQFDQGTNIDETRAYSINITSRDQITLINNGDFNLYWRNNQMGGLFWLR